MNHIFINGIELKVNNWNLNLLQFCEEVDLVIPRFCYHDELSVAGNCRMCLIEVKNSPKPVISCGCMLTKEMKVYTNSAVVKKAREYVMEFLLINHPLDCPICDQGGECDLQDQSFVYGSDRGRFKELKRTVEDIELGPFIKTIMTRCIHCTRCIRFSKEVLNIHSLSMLGRGRESEIGTYTKQAYFHELSGNVIDLCPVGALTSKPYAFSARPWELFSMETIDVLSSFCSDIKVDVKGNEIMRILPVTDSVFQTDWITDSVRFCFDALKTDRLVNPLYLDLDEDYFYSCSWSFIWFFFFKKKLDLQFVYGDSCDLETIALLHQSNAVVNSFSYSSAFNPDLLHEDLSCLIYNLDLKTHFPVLDSLFKKKNYSSSFFYIGKRVSFNYDVFHVSISNFSLLSVLKGKHFLCGRLTSRKVIFTNSFYSSLSTPRFTIYSLSSSTTFNNLSFFGNLHRLDKNPYCLSKKTNSSVVFLNSDSSFFSPKHFFHSIYIGHHICNLSMDSYLILPCRTFLEQESNYISFSSVLKKTTVVLDSLDLCYSMFQIISVFFPSLSVLNSAVPNYLSNSFIPLWVRSNQRLFLSNFYSSSSPSSFCSHLISKKSVSLQKAEFDKKKCSFSFYNFV